MRERLLPPGDVRLVGARPDELIGRLHISALKFARDLPDSYHDQRSAYSTGIALVPDPDTIRPCSPAEAAQYIRDGAAQERSKTDVVLYLNGALEHADLFSKDVESHWFGYTRSPAGQLTTTPTDPNRTGREGVHIDSGDEYEHRLGVCLSGRRKLLVATHSARAILGETVDVRSTILRERLQAQPELLGEVACLHITLHAGEGYDAFTGSLPHDGCTWFADQENGPDEPASEVIFAKL
jgi:hypothetical protein